MAAKRYIIIETRSHIARYRLKSDVSNLVRVRKGLYRTDNYLMVPSEDKKAEIVPYHLGDTQPRGHGYFIPSENTMAHIRLLQSNGKNASLLDGLLNNFNTKTITTVLIVVFAAIGILSGFLR